VLASKSAQGHGIKKNSIQKSQNQTYRMIAMFGTFAAVTGIWNDKLVSECGQASRLEKEHSLHSKMQLEQRTQLYQAEKQSLTLCQCKTASRTKVWLLK
jgi:hypothetical protein